MKKILLHILFVVLVFSCKSDKDDFEPVENPVYLDNNGVTIKAHTWAEVGQSGEVREIIYKIVDETTLRTMVNNGEDVTKVCTTKITNMNSLFKDKSFNENISSWDVSNVIDMSSMFHDNHIFNIDLSPWDVSKVTYMNRTFRYAWVMNKDLSDWQVNQVIDCKGFSAGAFAWEKEKPTFNNCETQIN